MPRHAAAVGRLPQRLRRAWLACGLATACALAVWSPLPARAAGPALAPAEAAQWLARIQRAAHDQNYQGTLAFSAGGAVTSSRVTHICDGRQRFERIEVMDGRAQSMLRQNDQRLTLWPSNKVAVLETRDSVVDFPALPASAAQRALDSYELRLAGSDRIAGHAADVVVVQPRDTLRHPQRWWVDRESGLLLRSDTLGSKGEVLESSAFTDLSIGRRQVPEPLAAVLRRLDGWRQVRAQSSRVDLEAEGWRIAGGQVAGFQLVNAYRRPLDASAADGAATPLLQSVFSDGLAHVSVFIEPYDAQRHKQAMRSSLGATHTVMSRRGDWWITVVGEVPMATALKFEAALERRP